MKVTANLRNEFTGISSVHLVAGDKFGVGEFDADSHTLTCIVKPGDPKHAGVQFRREFKEGKLKPKPPKTKPPEHAPAVPSVIHLVETCLPRLIITEKEDRAVRQVQWPNILVPEDVALDSVWKRSDEKFLGLLESDSELRDYLNFQKSSIPQFRKAIQGGGPLHQGEDLFLPVNIPRELDRYRCDSEIHRRINSAMTMAERDEYHERVFRELYGADIL